jgi:predicted lysophospholipase L1 biosynthesis ABC-type transport system permease subunit
MYQGRTFPEVLEGSREVVGVVADAKTAFLKEPAWPTVYIPVAQLGEGMARSFGSMVWMVRGNLHGDFARELRRAITDFDPRQRLTAIRPMDELVAATTASSRFDAYLFAFLAGLAMLLTAIGLYGVLSFSVARRTNEIGTRMALGATRGDVLRMVLRQGLGLIGLGLAIGLAGAFAVTRTLTTLLFGVRPTDPYTFGAVAALLFTVGLVASYIPARRATRVDPMVALRYE